MRWQTIRFPLVATLIVVPLAIGAPGPARTQPAPGPGIAQAPMASYDPPARVGRLSRISGTVSFHTAGQDQWEPASPNYPITSGNALWTEPGATTEVDIANSHVVAAERTELDIDTLDDHAIALTIPQGEAYLLLRDVPSGDIVTIRTPRGLVTIVQPGRYDVVAGDTEHPTTVTVVDGTARVSSDAMSPLSVAPGQTATLTGTDSFTGTVGAAVEDPFLRAQLGARVSSRVARTGVAAPSLSFMTGADVLDTTGEWAPAPDYGQVWYPPVDPGWAPYRDGNWAYVAPWGWTWVDAEPWGFAPFHYGRWVEVESRWGWVPEGDRGYAGDGRPVYAPALVRWVNFRSRERGGEDASVGWIPLGPRERFQPWYRSSPAYVRNVNQSNVTNVTNINNFANRRGLTVAPAAIVAGSQNVRPHMRAEPAALLTGASLAAMPRIRPTLATAGVTPAMARRVRVDPTPPGATPRPTGPGPLIQAHLAGAGAAAHPSLRPPGGGPMQPAAAQSPGQRPEMGRGPDAAAASGPGSAGPGAAALGGAVVGGAAALGGAALLNRPAHPSDQGRAGLPALTGTHTPGPASAAAPGAAPGPPITPHAATQGGPGAPSLPGMANRDPGGPSAPEHAAPAPGPIGSGRQNGPPGGAAPPPLLRPPGSNAQLNSQPQVGAPTGRGAPPPTVAPPNQAHIQAPPAPQAHPAPAPQEHVQAPPAPQVRPAPPPQAHIQAPPPPQAHIQAPPPPQAHVAPPPQVHVQAPPAPQARPAPPPQVHIQAPPPPQARPAPPPQVHVQAPPPPQARPAPPPPAPRPSPPPAPAAHPNCPPGKHC